MTLRPSGESAHDGNTLLLAAEQPIREVVSLIAQPEALENQELDTRLKGE